MFNIGDRVSYQNSIYYVISRPFNGNMEIAPTRHGAGSIVVLADWLIKIA
jgi:hypothetical protein